MTTNAEYNRSLTVIPDPFPDDTFNLNAIYRKLQTTKEKVNNIRITEGKMLDEHRKKVEADGKIGWEAYCNRFLERSYRDVKRVIAIARAPDPEGAAEKEREENRDRKREARAAQKGDGRPSPPSRSTLSDLTADADEAPDLSTPEWREKFAKTDVIDGEIEELLSRIRRLEEGTRATLFTKLREEYTL